MKAQHEMASWVILKRHIVCESSWRFFGERKHLPGPVKIMLGEWIWRVTCLNGKYCQNLVPNTATGKLNDTLTQRLFLDIFHSRFFCPLYLVSGAS